LEKTRHLYELTAEHPPGDFGMANGYMVNYGLGSVLTADIRQRMRDALGPFETGNMQWYSWTSERLLRFGEDLDTSVPLKQFLGRAVSPQSLINQIRRIAPKR
jgi:Zn-dependent M32 family carboxypeptidase